MRESSFWDAVRLHIQAVISGGPVDTLIITHAHNDHAGYVLALVSKFPRMRIICSEATQHLLPTMWADSAKVMERTFAESDDGANANPPLYGHAEAEAAEDLLEAHPIHRQFSIGELRFTLFPAGHILGAIGVVIEGGHRRVVVTGDISGLDDHYLWWNRRAFLEALVAGADLLVIETDILRSENQAGDTKNKALWRPPAASLNAGDGS